MSDRPVEAARENAQAVIDIIRRDGSITCVELWQERTCMKLHGKSLLNRDAKNGKIFTLSSEGLRVYGAPVSAGIPEGARIALLRRVDSIDDSKRLRPVDLAKVASMMPSIAEIGLKTPISVFGKPDDPRVILSAGGHRLEIVRQLGWEMVPCFHEEGDALDAEIWEIDENLIRSDLTPADRALFTARRKEIYLLKHPETAQHVAGGRARQSTSDKLSFAESTAQAVGTSVRTVERDASRGAAITERALHLLRGSRLNNGEFLDRLKMVDADKQELYVTAALDDLKRKAIEVKENRTAKMAVRREVRTAIINSIAAQGEAIAGRMPRAAYPIGYCDFPWRQEARSEETGQDRGLMYPWMSIEDGMALCAGDRSPFTLDALLYFWTTTNRQRDAMRIGEAWGFEFVTSLTWDKVHIGMGFWVRDQTEHLYIFKRGNFPGIPLDVPKPASLYREPKTEHSRKPVHYAEEIERLFPDMRKLELFQRRQSLAPGDIRLNGNWDFWGNEAGAPEHEVAA